MRKISKPWRLNVIIHSIHTIFRQALHSWFQNEFVKGNKKLEAVRELHVDASAINARDSLERRLLSSVCYEFGTSLVSRFHLAKYLPSNRILKDKIRKAAHILFWSHLENLHVHADMKTSFGGRSLSLKAVCSSLVSMAISNKCKLGRQGDKDQS